MILGRLAEVAWRLPRTVVGAAMLFLVVAGVYAAPAATRLPSGGYDVPSSESARAEQILDERFRTGGLPVVFTVTDPAGAGSVRARDESSMIVAALQDSPHAVQIASYWTAPSPLDQTLLSADRNTGLVVARIAGDDREAPIRAHEIAASLVGTRDGVTVTAGGQAITYYEGTQQSRSDLIRLEIIAVPLTFIALVWVFGSLVAALLPLLVAAIAVVGTGACLWALYAVTDVSVFAVNLATGLCLALAVDYTLFIVNRFREERDAGTDAHAALVRTMLTAGRTVFYSALTMAVTLATLLIFEPYLLRSLAYAGLASVGFAMAGALCVAPALIVLAGDRIDALDVRKPLRRWFRREAVPIRAVEDSFWYRTSAAVMRRPVVVLVTLTIALLTLAWPFQGVQLAYPDDRALPESTTSRQTGDILRADFAQDFAGSTPIVLTGAVTTVPQVADYARELSTIDGVLSVSSPGGVYAKGMQISPLRVDSAISGDSAYVTVSTTKDPYSQEGKEQSERLREVRSPAPTLFGGLAQRDLDNVHGITDRVPVAVALIALATFVLMFLMTGSVVLPVKALVTNALSLTAGFGAMVWIFQDGNLGGLGTTATGHVTAFVPPLLAAIAYALSMDYEVFVLSRIREEWLATGNNQRSVCAGLARTGRIVTAAAVVMTVVFLAITAGEVSFMRGLGLGLTICVLVDAFVVRTFLVPAVMALTGRYNWWAPAPLARWHARRGFREGEAVPIPELRKEQSLWTT